jgi:hypothetical protein
MDLVKRRVGAALAACLLTCAAAPQPAPTPRKLPPIDASIAIAVNGELLPLDPAPRIVGGGRLVVPVVRIYSALGIAVSRNGTAITASAPGKRIVLHIGSAAATIDDRPVTMETPALTIDGATYVPLRFVAESLGAQATFDPSANRVEVVSSLVGRNPALEQQAGNGASQLVGNVSAVDLNSAPETLSIVRGPNVRTVAITSDARFDLQDVVARTSTPGTFADVHVGDAVSVILLRDGRVASVIVRYASRNGTIAATSPTQFVLNTGFILSPDPSTTISLNGEPAAFGDLAVGDSVVVRLNPDTNEKRQIIVSRVMTASPGPAGPAAIDAFTIDVNRALRSGDAFDVTLHGTPGGRATFDIGSYLTALPLTEVAPGVYATRYVIPPNVNFGPTTAYGHLSVGGTDAPRLEAPSLLAVSNTPPQITDIAPLNGQSVNNDRPSIYATFSAPTGVGVNPASATIVVNGLDVTASATRTDQFITYSPSVPLADGPVAVAVRVADQAGNVQTRSWSFTIRAH